MDSGELNKIAGGAIGALLVFLLLGFFSQLIYFGPGGHDEEEPTLAFAVEVETKGADGGGSSEKSVPWSDLLANANPSNGENIFKKCSSCHAVEDGNNKVGPHLYNVVGREIASVEGYQYSDALKSKEGAWDLESLFGFLDNPSGWAPGTKMGYSGLKGDQDKVDLIAWLNQQGPEEVELTAPEGAESGGGEASGEGGGEQAATGGGGSGNEHFASADPAAGEKVFAKCKACHKVEDGANAVGPHLYNVVGREVASVDGYSYSDAMKSWGEGKSWDPATLDTFLENPQGVVEGTKMSYNGVKDAKDRANLIAYLNQQGPEPVDLAAAGGGGMTDGGSGGGEGAAAEGSGSGDGAGGTQQSAASGDQGSGSGDASGGAASGDGASGEGSGGKPQSTASDGEGGGDASGQGPGDAEGEGGKSGGAAGGGTDEKASAGGSGSGGLDFASADTGAGEKVFRKCQACHKAEDGKNGVGPHLHGVVGREVASVDGYSYSDAMKSWGEGKSWDPQTLAGYLENPQGVVKGTKMAYAGLKKPEDRANVIAWLNEQSDNPVELSAGSGGSGDGQKAEGGGSASGDGKQAAAASGEGGGSDGGGASGGQSGDAARAEGSGAESGGQQQEAQPADGGDRQQAAAEGEKAQSSGESQDTAAASAESGSGGAKDGDASSGDQQAAAQSSGEDEKQAEASKASSGGGGGENAASSSGGQAAAAKTGGLDFASADVAAGEKVFRKCSACHKLDQNVVGPMLKNVVGREIAAVDGYSYSDALKGKDGNWTPEHLDAFLENPRGWAKGTKMVYPGLKKEQDRINVIAWLNEQGDEPMDLAAGSGGGESASSDGTGELAASPSQTGQDSGGTVGADAGEAGKGSADGKGELAASPSQTGQDSGGTASSEADGSGSGAEGLETAGQSGGPAAGEQAQASDGAAQGSGSGDAASTPDTQQANAGTPGDYTPDENGYVKMAALDNGQIPGQRTALQNGETLFRKCSACHKLQEGRNWVGPSLHGVVGREIASVEGYDYSQALAAKDGVWDEQTLDTYLANPQKWAPGTKMMYPGVLVADDRKDLIAYLREQGGSSAN